MASKQETEIDYVKRARRQAHQILWLRSLVKSGHGKREAAELASGKGLDEWPPGHPNNASATS